MGEETVQQEFGTNGIVTASPFGSDIWQHAVYVDRGDELPGYEVVNEQAMEELRHFSTNLPLVE